MIGVTVSQAARYCRDYYGTSARLGGDHQSLISLYPKRRGQPRSRSHVHNLCLKQTDVGCRGAPLMLLHPRIPGLLLGSQGASLADIQRFLGDTAQVRNPDGVSVAFAIFAV